MKIQNEKEITNKNKDIRREQEFIKDKENEIAQLKDRT